MEFSLSFEADRFPTVNTGGLQPSDVPEDDPDFSMAEVGIPQLPGLLAEGQEFVQPRMLHYLADDAIDCSTYHMESSDFYTGSSGVPLRAPIPISYYRTLPPPLVDDVLSRCDEYVGVPLDDDLLPYSTEYAHVLADNYSTRDDFKLTASEEAELLDAYTDRPTGHVAVESSSPHDVLPCGRSSDNDCGTKMGPTLEEGSESDCRSEENRSDEEHSPRVPRRKTYFRGIADNVGFNITDPDTISSHDKKRHYIDCLEDYVEWLEQQIRIVGHDPLELERLPLERVMVHRGLTGRSLRTLLVHKQQGLYVLNLDKLQAEGKFMELQNAILARQRVSEGDEPYLPYMETGSVSWPVERVRAI